MRKLLLYLLTPQLNHKFFAIGDSYQNLVTPESANNLIAIESSCRSSLTPCLTKKWSRNEEVLSEIKTPRSTNKLLACVLELLPELFDSLNDQQTSNDQSSVTHRLTNKPLAIIAVIRTHRRQLDLLLNKRLVIALDEKWICVGSKC